jgi:hypothetical protein
MTTFIDWKTKVRSRHRARCLPKLAPTGSRAPQEAIHLVARFYADQSAGLGFGEFTCTESLKSQRFQGCPSESSSVLSEQRSQIVRNLQGDMHDIFIAAECLLVI